MLIRKHDAVNFFYSIRKQNAMMVLNEILLSKHLPFLLGPQLTSSGVVVAACNFHLYFQSHDVLSGIEEVQSLLLI